MRIAKSPLVKKKSLLFQTGDYTSRLSDQPQSGFHESFRTNDKFFQHIIDSLEEYAVFTMDTAGNISSWNSGATRILGYKEKEIVGKNASILYTLEDIKIGAPEKELLTAAKKGKADDERWHVRRDKSRFWGSSRVFPLYDSEKKLRGFIKIMRNLTERKRNEETEKKFQSIIENSSDGVRMIDAKGRIIYASPSTERILGYTKNQYLNLNIISLIHPEDKRGYKMAIDKSLKNPGKLIDFTYRIKHKNNTYRWMEGVGVNLLHDSAVKAIISNFRDITDRKDIETRKDEFVSMASHELKTPITSLNLFADLLKKQIQAKKYDNVQDSISKIKKQTNKLTELVNDLLDVSRIETGKMRFRMEKFNMHELLMDIVEDMQYTTTKHHIVCKVQNELVIKADKYRIFQVLTNLLTNAMKYSPNVKPILVKAKKKDNFIEVSVKDEGIGIAKDQYQKIFEKLYQVGDSKEKTFPGLGMGLYISNEIVTRHGGKMWVTSKKGNDSTTIKSGSTFYFTLPIK